MANSKKGKSKSSTAKKKTSSKANSAKRVVDNKHAVVSKKEIEIKKVHKKQLKPFFSFIIALIIVGFISYFAYDNLFKIEPPTYSKANTSNIIMSDEDANTLGKEKFQWLISQKNPLNDEYIFFKNSKVSYNNIKDEDVLGIAYRLSENRDRKSNSTTAEVFDKNILKEQVNNYFTSEYILSFVDFRPTGSQLCTFDNNNYSCTYDVGELENDYIYNIGGFLNATMVNNNLYVYSTILSVKRDLDVYHDEEKGIYKYNDLDNKIDDLSFYSKYENQMTRDNMDLIIKHYKNELPVYKSTFKLEKNNYVWVSTELQK